MALTVTEVYKDKLAALYEHAFTIDFDSSYPTGGESLTSAQLGFSSPPKMVRLQPKSGYVFEYDATNEKVIAYYGDNNNASDGPLIEVPDTTNLSTVTGVKCVAKGAFK